MKYCGLNKNDIVNGEGISVSLFVSGCPHHCPGCFNPEAWDYGYGKDFTWDTIQEIVNALEANNILRNLSILGGEPLAPLNREVVAHLINEIRNIFGYSIKIYLWTGYVYEDLIAENDENIETILSLIDVLIDGPYKEQNRDLGLKLRGSSNQRILKLNN